MPYPLTPDAVFTSFDSIEAEIINYINIRWFTEFGNTEPIKFPNYPLVPEPKSTDYWLELEVLPNTAYNKCIGSDVREQLIAVKITLHSPLRVGTGGAIGLLDKVALLFPLTFKLRSLSSQKGLKPRPLVIGERNGFYDQVYMVPLECILNITA